MIIVLCPNTTPLPSEPTRDLITTASNTFGAVTIAAFGYENDGLGRRTARVDTTPSLTVNNAFGYNAKSEVTSATMANGESIYDYDSIGNRLFASLGAATNSYTANALNQYSAITDPGNTVNPVYDLDGNIITNGVWSFRWDAENRMVAAYSNDTLLAVNVYDDQSRRIRKVTAQGTRTFLYDGWNVLRETAGASTNYFLWGLDLSGTMQGAGGVGGLLAVVVDGAAPATYYPCYDANGNITSYVDESGAVRASYVFDAFGQTISQGGDMAATFSHRFSTKYVDDETGLYYYGYRYYAPGLGRWVSRDPIEEQGGLNILCFNRNNPTTEIDVLGLYNPVTGSGGPYPSEPFPGPYPQAQTSGPDVTAAVLATLADIENVYKGWTLEQRCKACITLYTDRKSGWDIFPLYYLGIGYTKDWPFVGRASDGQYTVQFKGKGYHASAVNYVMWGKANKLCHETFRTPFIDMWSLNIALTAATAHKIFPPNWYAQANEAQAFTIYGYTGFLPQVLPLPWVGRPSGLRTSPDLVGPSQPFNWRWMPNHP